MRVVFADSFYFLAATNRRDAAHSKTVEYVRNNRLAVVTTAWVVTEVADALAAGRHRAAVSRMLATLSADPTAELVGATDELFHKGVQLYDSRPDKEWSLTDCISFVVMQEKGLTEALTGDHHFEQAGFVALLK
jgi:predicted nucleic acid-binding protein